MVIRYFDKDGKQHRLNLGKNQPIWIGSEIGNTGEYAEFRVDEHQGFKKALGTYTTMGTFDVHAASEAGMSISAVGLNQILIGPSC